MRFCQELIAPEFNKKARILFMDFHRAIRSTLTVVLVDARTTLLYQHAGLLVAQCLPTHTGKLQQKEVF